MSPLASIELPQTADAPGWFHHGAKILELIEAHRPLVCVELGTFLGASAIPVARSVARWGGTVTCIDTWAGDRPNSIANQLAAPWMLVECARNILVAGVGPHVRLVPSTTADAAAAWTQPIDYLYIDADHSFEGCRADLQAWYRHVRPGGLIVGDDYDSPLFPGVRRAWDTFEGATWDEPHLAPGLRLHRYQSDTPQPDGIRLVYGFKE